jgi:hypothetical protein
MPCVLKEKGTGGLWEKAKQRWRQRKQWRVHKQRNAEGLPQPPEAGRSHEVILSWSFWGERTWQRLALGPVLQNCARIYSCCLSHLVCGNLLHQFQKANTLNIAKFPPPGYIFHQLQWVERTLFTHGLPFLPIQWIGNGWYFSLCFLF